MISMFPCQNPFVSTALLAPTGAGIAISCVGTKGIINIRTPSVITIKVAIESRKHHVPCINRSIARTLRARPLRRQQQQDKEIKYTTVPRIQTSRRSMIYMASSPMIHNPHCSITSFLHPLPVHTTHQRCKQPISLYMQAAAIFIILKKKYYCGIIYIRYHM